MIARWAVLVAGLLSGAAQAACPDAATLDRLAAAWLARAPLEVPQLETLDDGRCAQRGLVERLGRTLGPRVGFKAGLTNAAVRARFGVDTPLRGVLLRDMLVSTGAEVPVAYGARPMVEADLVVRVKDPAALMAATTRAEALAALDAILPFLELADLGVADPSTLTAPAILAIDVGARRGVLGAPIPVQPAHLQALGGLVVVVVDGSGQELARGAGHELLEHPLDAVLWLVRDLRAAGETLSAGDLLSLGAMGKPFAPPAGQTITARYSVPCGGRAPPGESACFGFGMLRLGDEPGGTVSVAFGR